MNTKSAIRATAIMLCIIFMKPVLSQVTAPDLRGFTLRLTPAHVSTLQSRSSDDRKLLKQPGVTAGYHADTVYRYSINSGNERTAYVYDANGLLLSTIGQMWVINQWTNNAKVTGLYDVSGNLLTETSQIWQSNGWVNDRLLTHTYDGAGHCITTISQNWDGTGWINSEKSEYTWDTGGNMVTALSEFWDGFDWMNNSYTIYTYDGNGNCLTSLGRVWDGMSWIDDGLETFTWDGNNKLLSDLFQFWDGTLWGNVWMGVYTNDGNGNRITTMERMWDGMTWIDNYADTMYYDAAGNYVSYINYNSWDGLLWEPYSRGDFAYDATGNALLRIWEIWNMGDWENLLKVEYANQAGFIKADAYEWTGSTWNAGDSYFSVVYNDNGEKSTFYNGAEAALEVLVYYSAVISGIDPSGAGQPQLVEVYPNPAGDFVNIWPVDPTVIIEGMTLVDIAGRQQQVRFAGNRIDLSSLGRGIYLLVVSTSDGRTVKHKIVKL